MQEKLGVHYIKNDEIFKSKNLRFPGDNTYIKSENELNNYLANGKIKEFKFYIENKGGRKQIELRNDNEFKKNKNDVNIEFEQKHIEKIINIKDSTYFFINDIKILNTTNKSYEKLCFIKDEENSSNEITFFNNSKKINKYELKINDELEPNNSIKINIPLDITNAQYGHIYKMRIYIIEQDRYISSPFDITITINKKVENKEEIKKDFNKKYNDKEIISEKAEKIYNELNLKNTNNDKKEIISIIIENNFNKENDQKFIIEQLKNRARNLYIEFRNSSELDFSKYSEEEIINKIIELNFDSKNIKKFFIIDENEKMVNEIYTEFERDYEVSSFIDEEIIKNKIRELNFDKNKINEWIETFLINDGLYY